MRRSLNSSVTALLIAGLTGLAESSLALTHAYAHREESEHAGDHGDHSLRAANGANDVDHDGLVASVHAANHSKGHDHLQLSQALSMRLGAPMFVLPAASVNVPSVIVFVGTASLLLTAAPARAEPSDAPARQPRAPPFG